MSVALQFKLTQTGQAAVWNANNTGTSLNLTHIQFGSGNRAPSGTETALLNPQQAVAIAAGFSVSTTQIRMSAIFSGNQNYVVREVGLWAGDPAVGGSKLVGYWSQAAGDLAMKSPGVDFIFSHDMTLDAAVPAGSLTILADNAQSAMLAMITAHEAATNPHNQYATKAAVQAQTYTAFTTAGAAPTFALTASPAIAAYAAGQRFRVKFGAAGTGADSLNVNGLGAKSIKQYDHTGAKVAAFITANQLADAEFDGTDFVILDPLPGHIKVINGVHVSAVAGVYTFQRSALIDTGGYPACPLGKSYLSILEFQTDASRNFNSAGGSHFDVIVHKCHRGMGGEAYYETMEIHGVYWGDGVGGMAFRSANSASVERLKLYMSNAINSNQVISVPANSSTPTAFTIKPIESSAASQASAKYRLMLECTPNCGADEYVSVTVTYTDPTAAPVSQFVTTARPSYPTL